MTTVSDQDANMSTNANTDTDSNAAKESTVVFNDITDNEMAYAEKQDGNDEDDETDISPIVMGHRGLRCDVNTTSDPSDNGDENNPEHPAWWDKMWAERQEWDWSTHAAFVDVPPPGAWLVEPIDDRQRSRMHWLGHSNAWVDAHLRNWAEAAGLILQQNCTAPYPNQQDGFEPSEEELQTRERKARERTARQAEKSRAVYERALAQKHELEERQRQEPVQAWQHERLRKLGKMDAWIDEHVHNRQEAQEAIFELNQAAWKREEERKRAQTEKVVWLDAEVPESHVFGELVTDAKANLRLIEQVLQLPPTRLRWYDDLGPEEEVTEAQLGALCAEWGCDVETVRSDHLFYRTVEAQRNLETGQLYYLDSGNLGSVDPDEPTTIRLRADHERLAPWREPDHHVVPDYPLWDIEFLETESENVANSVNEISVREVLAYCARLLWQDHHFKEDLLKDEDMREADARIFCALTVSLSAYARIRGRLWFEEFVGRHAPLKAGHGPDDRAEDAA